ncbi:MAG: PorT family protein [Bacteroidia bacterium]|nr:PorT family protein [Bacteroidia bacterium]
MLISQTGSKFSGDGGEFITRLTTLDIPVMFGKRIGLGPLGVRIQVGPVLSTVLSAKSIVDISGVGKEDVDVKDETQSPLIGLQAGVGVDISKFSIDLRYHHGLTGLDEEDVDDELKISALLLTLGFKIL